MPVTFLDQDVANRRLVISLDNGKLTHVASQPRYTIEKPRGTIAKCLLTLRSLAPLINVPLFESLGTDIMLVMFKGRHPTNDSSLAARTFNSAVEVLNLVPRLAAKVILNSMGQVLLEARPSNACIQGKVTVGHYATLPEVINAAVEYYKLMNCGPPLTGLLIITGDAPDTGGAALGEAAKLPKRLFCHWRGEREKPLIEQTVIESIPQEALKPHESFVARLRLWDPHAIIFAPGLVLPLIFSMMRNQLTSVGTSVTVEPCDGWELSRISILHHEAVEKLSAGARASSLLADKYPWEKVDMAGLSLLGVSGTEYLLLTRTNPESDSSKESVPGIIFRGVEETISRKEVVMECQINIDIHTTARLVTAGSTPAKIHGGIPIKPHSFKKLVTAPKPKLVMPIPVMPKAAPPKITSSPSSVPVVPPRPKLPPAAFARMLANTPVIPKE